MFVRLQAEMPLDNQRERESEWSKMASLLATCACSFSTTSLSRRFSSLQSISSGKSRDPFHIRPSSSTPTCLSTENKRALRAAVNETSVSEPPQAVGESEFELVTSLKLKLLNAVSGLNRGLAANEDDLRKVDSAAKELENVGGPVDLSSDLDKLQGRWRLIYSSAFSSRRLGGSRPGPPLGRLLPLTLGQVFQRIDVVSQDFDNIVELLVGTPWPIPPFEVTATLAHKFELIGNAKIKIIFEKTTVKPTGSFSQLPPLDLPRIPDALRPASNTGAGEFEVTYTDSDIRITRGDKGELRVSAFQVDESGSDWGSGG